MSVVATSPVAYRRSSGYADPRYPEGHWLGSVTVSGDASGGTITASIVFSEAIAQLDSRIYSLEQFTAFSSTESSTRAASFFTDNLGLDGPAALTNRFTGTISPHVTPDTTSLSPRDMTNLPLFLGSMRVRSILTRLGMSLVNPGVGEDYRLEAQGYWWGARSVLVDGGPQRPPTGLYRA